MMRIHKVKPAETLESISEAYYGEPDYDLVIYGANKHVIENPNVLYPGQTIVIPYLPLLPRLVQEILSD